MADNSSIKRCVNLDWLEVHAREPINEPHNAEYFRQIGWFVREREYGTRVYREMFTLESEDGHDLIEVRRNPASQGLSGIHDANECHIRLVNRVCYYDNAADYLDQFLAFYGYYDVRVSRADVCLDFVTFDEGDEPNKFLLRYLKNRYSKINQGRIYSHGADTWAGREWNSVSWGSPQSPISTKMYNKTMELYDIKTASFKKPWIRQAWVIAGLIDDWMNVTKDGQLVNVWRVEFSIKSSVKNWVKIDIDGDQKQPQSIHNTLDCYKGRDRLLVIFASLAQHYFHFKKFKPDVRKDLCPDKVLFRFSADEQIYKVGRPDYAAGSVDNKLLQFTQLIEKLRDYKETHFDKTIHAACDTLIESMSEEDFSCQLAAPWSEDERKLMRHILKLRAESAEMTTEAAMNLVRDLLNINDRTLPKFT